MLDLGLWLVGHAARATSLVALLVLPLLSFAPWPSAKIAAKPQSEEVEIRQPDSKSESTSLSPLEKPASTIADDPKSATVPKSQMNDSFLKDFTGAFREEWKRRAVAVDQRRAEWPRWVAWGFLLGLSLGASRLAVALIAAEIVRKRAKPVIDEAMLDHLALARAEMGCLNTVDLRESDSISGPAVLGGRRPCILLPNDWREWGEAEREAVLAHELAHVMRQDFLKGLIAHVGVVFHFYLPPVYWLAARLRLEQELGADAWGARLSGGRERYLKTLARLALRRDDRPAAWPARTFLPGRGMFLRRIEMLRIAEKISHEPTTKRTRLMVFGALAASAIVVAAWRGPKTNAALAAEPASPVQGSAKSKVGKLDMSYIPEDCPMFVIFRPADILGRPEFAGVLKRVKALLETTPDGEKMPPFEKIEQVTIAWSRSEVNAGPGPKIGQPAVIFVRSIAPLDWKSIMKRFSPDAKEESHAGKTYYRIPGGENAMSFGLLNDHTMIAAKESRLKDILAGIETPKGEHEWDEAWQIVPKGTAAFALDVQWFADMLGPVLNQPGGPQAMFAPLWKDAKALALTIDESKGLSVHGVVTCKNDDGTKRVAETLDSVLVLAKNGIEQVKQQLENMPPNAPKRPVDMRNLINKGVEPLLASAKIKQDGKIVRLDAESKLNVAATIEAMLPAVTAARDAARRAQSTNNMKQIGLAFHNFHSTLNRFPGNIKSKDGKPLLSWRVAILPYIDLNGTLEQFHQDEPWDSPHNKKLIELMPAAYAVPGANLKKGMTSYFALNGPDTVITKDGDGSSLAQITDGTSNTILVVEAKREIPWTKPDDIPFDAAKAEDMPKLGGYFPGGFSALFCDGSVRFIKDSIDLVTFKALSTKSVGELVNADDF